MIKNAYVVSDLHLFAPHSDYPRHRALLESKLKDADLFIFNGDTFDFRWQNLDADRQSGLAVSERMMQAALQWIHTLAHRFPHCTFHFIAGNHDGSERYLQQLKATVQTLDNVEIHEYYLFLSPSLFLHGDAIFYPHPKKLSHYRQKFSTKKSSTQTLHRYYQWAIHLRLHRIFCYTYTTKQWAAKRILKYLDTLESDIIRQCTYIYYGHTHRPVSAYLYQGKQFYNTGSMIRHLNFNIEHFPYVTTKSKILY